MLAFMIFNHSLQSPLVSRVQSWPWMSNLHGLKGVAETVSVCFVKLRDFLLHHSGENSLYCLVVMLHFRSYVGLSFIQSPLVQNLHLFPRKPSLFGLTKKLGKILDFCVRHRVFRLQHLGKEILDQISTVHFLKLKILFFMLPHVL